MPESNELLSASVRHELRREVNFGAVSRARVMSAVRREATRPVRRGWLSPVAALGDMMRRSGNDNSPAPRHHLPPSLVRDLFLLCSDCQAPDGEALNGTCPYFDDCQSCCGHDLVRNMFGSRGRDEEFSFRDESDRKGCWGSCNYHSPNREGEIWREVWKYIYFSVRKYSCI